MQVLWCFIGLIVMIFAAFFNYQNYQRLALPLLIVSAALLLLVYVPGVGVKRGGGTRWIGIAGVSFQPVELAKLALVIYIAQYLNRKGAPERDGRRKLKLATAEIAGNGDIKNFKRGILPSLLVLLVFFGLIYRQPDFGSLILIGSVVFVMLFVGGARVHQITLLTVAAGLVICYEIWREPYRLRRWLTFLDPWKDPDGAGYQITQSFYALGSGGILGTGLGAGMQKLHYLPAAHTDFIFAVIGEELGFVGSLFIILLFMVIVWRGVHISLSTQERFGSLLAIGLTLLIGVQAAINIGVVTGALPTKGLTLPFISFGGSSMLVSLISVGILLNIHSSRRSVLSSRQ
jgi:cell division protein FtsW